MSFRPAFPALLILVLALAAPGPGRTASFQIDPLYFGSWVMTNNAAPHSVIVNTDGSYSHDPALYLLEPPRPGVYRITELPVSSTINSVNVSIIQDLRAGGYQFDMDNFDVLAPDTDGDGETIITIGAEASTSGSGTLYPDAVFTGQLLVVLNF